MAFSLPPLPYSADALAGQKMCQETLELHHGKHHNAYVTALNGLVESKNLKGKSLEDIVVEGGAVGVATVDEDPSDSCRRHGKSKHCLHRGPPFDVAAATSWPPTEHSLPVRARHPVCKHG